MRIALLAAVLCSSAVLAQKSQPPQSIPNPPRETGSAVARYIKYDTAKNILYLEHVRVMDGTGGPALEDVTLVLSNGKVVDLIGGTDKGVHINAGCFDDCPPALHLDMTGHTVFPGLVGMHDHMYYIARPNLDAEGRSEPPLVVPQMTFTSPHLYLGAGVTTLRTTGCGTVYRPQPPARD